MNKALLLVIVIVILITGVFLRMGKQFKHTITLSASPTMEQTQTNSELPNSTNAQIQIYKNMKYGYTVKYPASIKWNVGCNGNKSISEIAPLSVFDDRVKETLFIAPSTGTFTTEAGSPMESIACKQVDVTTTLLENIGDGITSNPYPTPSYYYDIYAIRYDYAKINSDADLQALSEKVFGSHCKVIYQKTPIKNEPGVYQIEMTHDSSMNNILGKTVGCSAAGFGYDFIYSSANHVAVVGNTRQNCVEQIVHGSCGANISFP